MSHYDKLFQDTLSEALEGAIRSITLAFDRPEQLLGAKVGAFEKLDCCVFAYFNRDDVFYVNQAARKLLRLAQPRFGPALPESPPIFWLENNEAFRRADEHVARYRCPIADARELVALPWGKTWLRGIKFPILSTHGAPIAYLFAGYPQSAADQIRNAARHYQSTPISIGVN